MVFLERVGRWICRHPLATVVIVLIVAALVAPMALEAFLFGTAERLMVHLVLPLIPIVLIVWAILLITGYGRWWGKKGGKKD